MKEAAPIGLTLEERIKHALVPARPYILYRAYMERPRGEKEMALSPYLADRRKLSIDAGANKGVHTCFLGKLSKAVHAFEPKPTVFSLLERTRPANARVYPVTLSDRPGTATFRIPRGPKGLSRQRGSRGAAEVKGDSVHIEVTTRRLDEDGFRDVGFIKIDVEGSEQAVLDGARETIAASRPVMLIEMEEAHAKRPIEESIAGVMALGHGGVFLCGGRLHSLDDFDPERHHRQARTESPEDYAFNLIFLPHERGTRRGPGAP